MESRLVVLKLFLDALGVSSDIDTVSDRKRVQKAVYLGQLSGVDLGYRYSWYVMGPYSPPLTRDYYQLADELATEDDALSDKSLRPETVEKLASIKPLLQVPADVPVSEENWMELVASYDYLRRVSGYSHQKAVEVLNEQKPHVAPYVSHAATALKAANLPA